MNAFEARRSLLDALTYASVGGVQSPQWRQSFLDGTADVALESLDMDSLAVMELCIAVEANTGVSITPNQLQQIQTLGEIVALMLRASN